MNNISWEKSHSFFVSCQTFKKHHDFFVTEMPFGIVPRLIILAIFFSIVKVKAARHEIPRTDKSFRRSP